MYVGVIFDKQTKMVADYMPEATLMEYTICDDGYKQNGTKWLPDAYIKTYLRMELIIFAETTAGCTGPVTSTNTNVITTARRKRNGKRPMTS